MCSVSLQLVAFRQTFTEECKVAHNFKGVIMKICSEINKFIIKRECLFLIKSKNSLTIKRMYGETLNIFHIGRMIRQNYERQFCSKKLCQCVNAEVDY